MRILVNHSVEDSEYRQNLMFLLKEQDLVGVATTKEYEIASIQETAKRAQCEAILLTNPITLQKLLGDEKATLDAYRGTRINYPIPVIVANPIQHIHSVTYGKFLLRNDLRKFKCIKQKPQPFSFLICDTQETQSQALAFLSQCLLISFDMESDSVPQMTCISFTGLHKVTGRVMSFVLPIVDFDRVHYRTKEELSQAILFLRSVAALPVIKIAFNGIYDSQYMIMYDAAPLEYLIDVMMLSWAKYSELPRSLDFVTSICCYDYFQWKGENEKSKKNKDIRGFWGYCAKDSWWTLRCFLELIKGQELEAYQIHNYNRTFRQTYPVLYTAYHGMLVNAEEKAKGRAEATEKQQSFLKDLRTMSANPTFNPGSWQQVDQWIYDVLGAKRLKRGGKTDAKTLNRVSMQHPLLARVCGNIIRYREESKAINQYYEAEEKNGRLLYNIDPTGAETGRFACKASSFWVGAQIQNIPPYFKKALWFDGWGIEADKNKAEARCVAYSSGCEPLIKALEDLDRDFYKVVSEIFFGIPWDQVTDEMRNDVTKHIIHGTHHCMGPEPFIDTATPQTVFKSMKLVNWKNRNMEEFVKYLLSLYHKGFPGVRDPYWKNLLNAVATTSKTTSPIGWTRHFFGDVHKQHKVFRGVVAHQSQNLSVDLINEEFWNIYRELVLPNKGEFRLIAQIHDSIVSQCMNPSYEVALQYAKEMHSIMTRNKTEVNNRIMLMPVDLKMTAVYKGSWGSYDEKNFPVGMRKIKL